MGDADRRTAVGSPLNSHAGAACRCTTKPFMPIFCIVVYVFHFDVHYCILIDMCDVEFFCTVGIGLVSQSKTLRMQQMTHDKGLLNILLWEWGTGHLCCRRAQEATSHSRSMP